jgi:hypothetical protein
MDSTACDITPFNRIKPTLHRRPAESVRAYTNCPAPSSLDSSDLLDLLAPRLPAFHDLQETNQSG